MQNYIEYKVNGISDNLNLQKKLNREWDLIDLYRISDNEQTKIKWYDSFFGIDTKPNSDIKENFSNHLFYKYQPTNYSFLEYLFLKYPFSRSDHLFDFGVGCGRVIYMAAFYGCERISGCELNKDYYNTVLSSIKRNNHRFITSATINIVNDDAQNIIFDSTINYFFFFNPFHLKVHIKVFKNILRSLEANKRIIKLFFYCPLQSTIEYINRFLNFNLLERINIDKEHVLFAVYQIS